MLTTTTRAILSAALLASAAALSSTPAVAQSTTGAGAAVYPSGTSLSGVSLSGLKFGIGVSLPSGGTVSGHFQATLLGTTVLGAAQNITVEGEANAGAVNADGSVTFSGVARVDMGDGTLPLTDVPFTVTATANSILLILGTTNLPSASVSAGRISIK